MIEHRILVVGSLNMDQVIPVPRIPALSETLLSTGSLRLVPGGKGANQAVAMARLGAFVAMAGRVGGDPFGGQLISSLQVNNVDTDLIVVDSEQSSGVACIFLTPEGNNAIVVSSGANMVTGKDASQTSAIVAAIAQSKALILQLEIPLETVVMLISTAHQAGVPVILNLAPAQQLSEETLRQVDVLILNETEASFLSGKQIQSVKDARAVATSLHERGISRVIITMGAQGAILATDDEAGMTRNIMQAAPVVEVVDTTAAGDCFVAAFTVAMIEGQQLEDALHFAVYASALKVTRLGAQSGLPTRAEVQQFQQHFTG